MQSLVILFAGLVLLMSLIGEISSLSVTVKDVECVHEYAYEAGSPISGHFMVGGMHWVGEHHDVDFIVTSPSGQVIYTIKESFGERFELVAPTAGMYKFCFKNTYHKQETVAFLIEIGHILHTPEHNKTKDEHFGPIFGKLYELQKALDTVKRDHKFLRDRENSHRWTNEMTREHIFDLTIVENVLLAILGIGQVFYIKHLFKNK